VRVLQICNEEPDPRRRGGGEYATSTAALPGGRAKGNGKNSENSFPAHIDRYGEDASVLKGADFLELMGGNAGRGENHVADRVGFCRQGAKEESARCQQPTK